MKTLNLFLKMHFTSLSPDEEWKYVNGYEEKYAVSNYGRLVSFSFKKPIMMHPNISCSGYKYVCLSKNAIKYSRWVHRIVADNFIENFDAKKTVNHIDGNKLNNHVGNLENITQRENSIHAVKIGLINNTNNGVCVKVDQFDLDGKFIKTHNSMLEASKDVKCTQPNIRGAANSINGQKTAMGFIWRLSNSK